MRRGKKCLAILAAMMIASSVPVYAASDDLAGESTTAVESSEEVTDDVPAETESEQEEPEAEEDQMNETSDAETEAEISEEDSSPEEQEETDESSDEDAEEEDTSRVFLIDDTFPDENFRQYIKDNIDLNGDGYLTDEETLDVTELNIQGLGISDLTGISVFDFLETLYCQNNKLARLGIYLEDNAYISDVECGNQNIDVTMENVDGKYVINLANLIGEGNIEYASVEFNNLYIDEELEISGDYLILPSDMIDSVVVEYGDYGWLDLHLHVTNYRYIALDEETFPDANFRKQLAKYDEDENDKFSYTELRGIQELSMHKMGIRDLTGINQLVYLTSLDCSGNRLIALDLSQNTNLTELDCSDNELETLDISGCSELKELSCYDNEITALDVSKCAKLQRLYCSENYLSELDLAKNIKLTALSCSYNELASLDITNNTNLVNLDICYNKLTQLDLSKNTKLEDLSAYSNLIAYVDLSKNKKVSSPAFYDQYVSTTAEYVNGYTYINLEKLVGKNNVSKVKTYSTDFTISGSYLKMKGKPGTSPDSNEFEYYMNDASGLEAVVNVTGYENHTSHAYNSWKVVKESTVFAAGTYQGTCAVCKATSTKAKAKLTPTIGVTASTVTLKTSQSTTGLKVTMAKGDSVASWKSSNTNIVKVSGKAAGTCTLKAGKKTGTAKITITLKSKKQKVVTVKVQSGEVKTTAIKGLSSKVSVKKGKTLTLKPTRVPFTSLQKFTYKSSNTKIATVSSKGVIKGVKAGKAKITVKSGTKSYTVTVTVK